MEVKAIAKMFGCTEDQVRSQFAKNAEQLRAMQAKANLCGKRVNGYTADEHARMAAECEAKSKP